MEYWPYEDREQWEKNLKNFGPEFASIKVTMDGPINEKGEYAVLVWSQEGRIIVGEEEKIRAVFESLHDDMSEKDVESLVPGHRALGEAFDGNVHG
jgi:hypothetical protein